MGRIYTLDGKLLCGSPEIRVGDKLYPVDDRQKTVKKALKIFKDTKDDADAVDKYEELFRLAFGTENAKLIEDSDLSFAAYSELAGLVISAMLGEDESKRGKKEDTFSGREMV